MSVDRLEIRRCYQRCRYDYAHCDRERDLERVAWIHEQVRVLREQCRHPVREEVANSLLLLYRCADCGLDWEVAHPGSV